MARIGQLFGGRNAQVDRDHDGVDDRTLDQKAGDTADRKVDPKVDRDHDGVDDRVEGGTLYGKADRDHDGVADRTLDPKAGPTVDLDHDGIDDRVESKRLRTSDRTHRIPAVGPLPGDTDTDRDGIADRRESHTTTMKPVIDREPVTDREIVTDPEVVAEPARPARASMLSTLGLIAGVVAVAAALTGLLAVWALPLGALGLLLSFGGILAGARRHVAGRGLGTLGVLFSGTAVVFAILAITGQVSWLDTDVDQVARLNEWLDTKVTWIKDW
ncbi:hypothetical protein ACQEVZ_15935 [Dactylosporangium sp. CA-152071]|uniref:hypothetical protein n=1 Tax=Dactylosporangium sp. CA-152071 TaxID=3239933 RepID=UPI003D9247C1